MAPTAQPAAEKRSGKIALRAVFFLTSLGIMVMLSILFYVFLESSRRSILQSSETIREAKARSVAEHVTQELAHALTALENVERDVRYRVVDMNNMLSVEADLFSEILANPRLSEISFTGAERDGWDDEGQVKLLPGKPWQIAVQRPFSSQSTIITRRVRDIGGTLTGEVRLREPDTGLQDVPFEEKGECDDPTDHLTFKTVASKEWRGYALWSDLHYSQTDGDMAEETRRIIVTVQKVVEDKNDRFMGVLRVGILTAQLDQLVRVQDEEDAVQDPHVYFIGDRSGRLITRLSPDSRLGKVDGELRVAERDIPLAVAHALKSPLLATLADKNEVSGRTDVNEQPYLVTLRTLPNPEYRQWILGVMVPEAHYTRDLEAQREQFLVAYLAVLLILVVGGGLTLRLLRRGLAQIMAGTARIRNLDFAPASSRAFFTDVEEIMQSMERAKTVMRALGKYVPVDLVRQLFNANQEPQLGGQLQDLSIMFTDIKGFTSLSENLSADALALKLGAYLETMTVAIHENSGVIDKFIGDAVMSIWNAPTACPDHARKACRAALTCRVATEKLYASPVWEGLPPLHTRFGIHKDKVMVGHFGAPERMSFTALGDGVNLASRLESLCKQYGVSIIVSQNIETEARGTFEFRFLDIVAVKGKMQGVRVFELLGAAGIPEPLKTMATTYERAFAVYLKREFAEARTILAGQLQDPPSQVLSDRCANLIKTPPPPDWDGVYVATSK